MTYDQVEDLYTRKDTLPQPLRDSVTMFHDFRVDYRGGRGDVITGLQWMDEMAKNIGQAYENLSK